MTNDPNPYPGQPGYDELPEDERDPRQFRSGTSKASLPMRTPVDLYDERNVKVGQVRIVRKYFGPGDVEFLVGQDGSIYRRRPHGLGVFLHEPAKGGDET